MLVMQILVFALNWGIRILTIFPPMWLPMLFVSWIVSVIAVSLKKKYLRCPFYFIVLVPSVIELFLFFFAKTPFSLNILQLLVGTDKRESLQFLHEAFTSKAFLYTMLILTVVAVFVYFVVNLCRKIKNRWVKYGCAVLTSILLSLSIISESVLIFRITQGFSFKSSFQFVTDKNAVEFIPTTGLRLLNGVAFWYVSVYDLDALVKTNSDVQSHRDTANNDLIVLVIGESYNKHHSSLYNPEYLDTTPCLKEWENKGNLVAFTDAVTPYNLTHRVMQRLFSSCPFEEGQNWTDYPFYTTLFKTAGYNVWYISNQFTIFNSDKWSTLATFLNNSKLSALQFTHRNRTLYEFDGDLLSEIPDVQELTTDGPALLIVHLYGQHMEYERRYTESFNRFSASDMPETYGGYAGKEMSAHYANSLLYNDYVVDRILNKIKDTDAICFYIADHGEEIYDFRDYYGRSQDPDMPRGMALSQFNVPYMVFMSDQYKAKHPEIVSAVIESKDRPCQNVHVFHTLLNLGGVCTDYYDSSRDVLSDNYFAERQRIVNDNVDYDSLVKQ